MIGDHYTPMYHASGNSYTSILGVDHHLHSIMFQKDLVAIENEVNGTVPTFEDKINGYVDHLSTWGGNKESWQKYSASSKSVFISAYWDVNERMRLVQPHTAITMFQREQLLNGELRFGTMAISSKNMLVVNRDEIVDANIIGYEYASDGLKDERPVTDNTIYHQLTYFTHNSDNECANVGFFVMKKVEFDSDSDEDQYFTTEEVSNNTIGELAGIAYPGAAVIETNAIWYNKEGADRQEVANGGFPDERQPVTKADMNAAFMAFSTSARAFAIGYPGTVFIFEGTGDGANGDEGWIQNPGGDLEFLETNYEVTGEAIALPTGIDWVEHTPEALDLIIAFWNQGALPDEDEDQYFITEAHSGSEEGAIGELAAPRPALVGAIWYNKEGCDGCGVNDGGFPLNREEVTIANMNAEFMAFSTSARAFSIGYPDTVFIFNNVEGWKNASFIDADSTVSGSQIAVPNEGKNWVGHTSDALNRIIEFWNGGA